MGAATALANGGGMSESNARTGSGDLGAAATGDLVVGEYRLGRRVGTDVFGDIYVGDHDGTNAVVTLLHDRIVIDRVAARRFAEETALVSDLVSWGVIPTLQFDFETQPRWIASASASGQLLRQRVEASGPLQSSAVRLLASRLGRALQALHARGVTQRDLSPDSVLLGAESAALWHSGWAGLIDGSEYAGTSHTEHVEWLAPEQFAGDATGPESDIHAWAVTLLYAATGFNPFAAEKASMSVSRLMRETPLIPPVFDPVLASLVAGALSKDPSARPTARDLVTFLDPGAPILEPSSSAPRDRDAILRATEAPEDDAPDVPRSPVDLEKRPRGTYAVDLSKSATVTSLEDEGDAEDGTGIAADGVGDALIDDELSDELDYEYDDDETAVTGRRIGLAPLVGLGALVVALGSVIGIVIGRTLAG